VRFKSLEQLKRRNCREVELATLPQRVLITEYAMVKALQVNGLVRTRFKESFEWYGYTIARRDEPEVIIDIGLPVNGQNAHHYTGIGPESIAEYQEALPPGVIINGWVHSHGDLDYRQFSNIDEKNHLTVLDYVTSLLRKPVARQEVVIEDLQLLVEGEGSIEELREGNVFLLTDVPVRAATLMETVYGGFCYAMVVGDAGWHRQKILCKKRTILSGRTLVERLEDPELVTLRTGRPFTESDAETLRDEIKRKIKPLAAHFSSPTAPPHRS